MKKIYYLFCCVVFLHSCTSSNVKNSKVKYFDENNVEISKAAFNKKRTTRIFLTIPGDSTHHKKLILREKTGEISDRSLLETILEKNINREIDSTKPIVIIYYPGKDRCNSSGNINKEWVKMWYGSLETTLMRIAQVKPIYIYKDDDGLERYEGQLDWKKDPYGVVERLFFEHHYPCASFVVISKEGKYISYFGEFGKKYVIEATALMN